MLLFNADCHIHAARRTPIYALLIKNMQSHGLLSGTIGICNLAALPGDFNRLSFIAHTFATLLETPLTTHDLVQIVFTELVTAHFEPGMTYTMTNAINRIKNTNEHLLTFNVFVELLKVGAKARELAEMITQSYERCYNPTSSEHRCCLSPVTTITFNSVFSQEVVNEAEILDTLCYS